MRPADWMDSYDTGLSSETIWFFMVDHPLPVRGNKARTPTDGADFGRCLRLLEHFPEWKKRLPEFAAFYPQWKPIVREWERLSELYHNHKGMSLHHLLDKLNREGGRTLATDPIHGTPSPTPEPEA